MKTPTMLLLFAFCLWSFVPATLEARDRDTVDYYFKEAEKVLSQGDRSQALRLFETALSYVNNKNGKKNEYHRRVSPIVRSGGRSKEIHNPTMKAKNTTKPAIVAT